MDVKLFKFSKRENSTKQPTGGTTFQCYLKEPTSVVNPTIVIETSGNAFPDYNYGYISTFGRYYFITDIVSDGYMWEISMQTDILATYKSQVSAASLYMLRCSDAYDGSIIDNFYPVSTSYTEVVTQGTSPFIHDTTNNIDVSTGTFIIGITAKPSGSSNGMYGSIRYYAMPKDAFVGLVDTLLDDTFLSGYLDSSEASIELQKSIIDPLQFIKSCIWIPDLYSSVSGFSTENNTLDVWSWGPISCKNKLMTSTSPYRNYNISINITAHPQAASRGSYMNCEPFTKLAMRVPGFGLIDLDTTLLKGSAYVRAQITMDYITGMGILEVYNANGVMLTRETGQIGVSIQLSQVSHDYIGGTVRTGQGLLGAIGSALTGNIVGAISGGLSAIGNAADIMRPVSSSIGSNGSFAGMYAKPALYHTFFEAVPDDNANIGRPLCQMKTVSTLSSGSFFIAREGDVSISGTSGEQAELKAFLEGGIFYE